MIIKSRKATYGIAPRVILVNLLLLAAGVALAQDVLRVASFDDLRRIGRSAGYPLSGHYELVCDIDASSSRERPFEPIGGGSGVPFTGRFYGRGGGVFVVRNLYIRSPAAGHVGLFGVVGYGAEVSGVGVAADSVVGSYAVGVLAGSSNGRIVNCFGSGVVVAGRGESDAGGLVGVNGGGVYGSYSTAEVYGVDNVGGLVGLLRVSAAGEVRQCFALGGVSGVGGVGGLVGQVFGGRVAESFSAGRVEARGGKGAAGGLVGRDFAASAAWGDRGVFEVGGEEGYVKAAEVSGSYWDVDASGQASSAGGLGRSGAEMRLSRTFAGWDFGGVWGMEEGVGYPQLAGAPLYTRRLVYAVDGEGCGRLRVSGSGGVAEMYGYGADVMAGGAGFEVAASAWAGCRFAGWSDGSTDSGRADAALRDTVFTAKFERVGGGGSRVYRYASGAGGELLVSGVAGFVGGVDTAVPGGGAVVAAALAGRGYRFAGWSDGVAGVVRVDSAPGSAARTARFVEEAGVVIKVSMYDDLYLIGKDRGYPLDAHYELVCDIEVPPGGSLGPLGSASAPFAGVFRGNGYVISGIDMGGGYAGLFGYAVGADIRGVRVEGRADGAEAAGLLAGMCVNTVIDSCGAVGAVRGRTGVGGLVGRCVNSAISRSYSAASVVGSGTEVGGLVGDARGAFLARSYSVGGVSGAGNVGGLLGSGVGGHVQDSYATGGVVGEGASGGFMGFAGGGVGVSRSYSAGYVMGIGIWSGGFIGTLGGGGYGFAGGAVPVEACYWDVGRSMSAASAAGAGRGAAEMALKGTYAGWDFDGVWEMAGGYPRLRGMAPDSVPGVAFEQSRGSAPVSVKPLVRVAGGAIYVNAPKGEPVRIRLVDMRGKTVAMYNVVGAAKLSINNNVASGGYMVEARRRGRREGVWPVRVFR